MNKEFVASHIRSRGVISIDNRVSQGKSFGYIVYPLFDLGTEVGLKAEKKLAFEWMTNNKDIISINYGEGHLWFAMAKRHGNIIIWEERLFKN